MPVTMLSMWGLDRPHSLRANHAQDNRIWILSKCRSNISPFTILSQWGRNQNAEGNGIVMQQAMSIRTSPGTSFFHTPVIWSSVDLHQMPREIFLHFPWLIYRDLYTHGAFCRFVWFHSSQEYHFCLHFNYIFVKDDVCTTITELKYSSFCTVTSFLPVVSVNLRLLSSDQGQCSSQG